MIKSFVTQTNKLRFSALTLLPLAFALSTRAQSLETFVSAESELNQALYSIDSARLNARGRVALTRIELAVGTGISDDLSALRFLLRENHLPVSRMTCHSLDSEKACAKKILNGSALEVSNINLNVETVLKAIEELPLAGSALADLDHVKQFLATHLGSSYRQYALGYNDRVDVFSLIAISQDRTKLIVLSGTVTERKSD